MLSSMTRNLKKNVDFDMNVRAFSNERLKQFKEDLFEQLLKEYDNDIRLAQINHDIDDVEAEIERRKHNDTWNS